MIELWVRDVIESSGATSYDENAKELLCDKNLLAHILSGVVDDLAGWEIDEIIPCIEGEPAVSRILVNRTPCVSGYNTEDISINEGRIAYDIRINVVVPVGDDDIKKVYSIWICASPEAKYRNTILKYSLKEDVLYGDVQPRNIRSLLNVVIINLDGHKNSFNMEEENQPCWDC